MERIIIPPNTEAILSTSSKGDQMKWKIQNKWVKGNARGYEAQAEILASLVLQHSTLNQNEYAVYYPCEIELPNGNVLEGCYSYDFRGIKQEVTLERLFEKHFTSTDEILLDTSLSTYEKFLQLTNQIQHYTGLDVMEPLARLFAFDALILNEDRHTNNILFLYDPIHDSWELAPLFDNGLSFLSDLKDYPVGKPLSILKRQVKAKPITTSFSKQLSLYKGSAFIDKNKLLHALSCSSIDFGRAEKVLYSQMNDPIYNSIWLEGGSND